MPELNSSAQHFVRAVPEHTYVFKNEGAKGFKMFERASGCSLLC
jgi:hypothetical protein